MLENGGITIVKQEYKKLFRTENEICKYESRYRCKTRISKIFTEIFFRKCNATKKSARKIIYNSMNDFKTQEYHTVK